MRFLHLLRLIAVASQARLHRIWLQETGTLASVRVVAGSAITLRSRMLNFGFFDFLCLFGVAGHAYRLRVGLRQNDLAVLRRRVTAVAHLVFERIVHERLHQLRLCGLMWIVALNAIRVAEWLAVMSLDQVRVFGVMAIEA